MAKKTALFSYRFACEYCGHIAPWTTKVGTSEISPEDEDEDRFQTDDFLGSKQNRWKIPNSLKTPLAIYKKAFAEGKYYVLNSNVKCPSCQKIQHWSWNPAQTPKTFLDALWLWAGLFLVFLLVGAIFSTLVTVLFSISDIQILLLMYVVVPLLLSLALAAAATTEANNVYHKNLHDFETVKAKNFPEVRWHEQNFEDMGTGPNRSRRAQRLPKEPPPLWESLSASQNLLNSAEVPQLAAGNVSYPAQTGTSPRILPALPSAGERQNPAANRMSTSSRRSPMHNGQVRGASAGRVIAGTAYPGMTDVMETGAGETSRETSRKTRNKGAAARETSAREAAAREAAAREASAREAAAREASAREAAAREAAAREAAAREAAAREASAREASAREAAAREAAVREAAAREAAAREAAAREAAVREAAVREAAARNSSRDASRFRETSVREAAARDAARDALSSTGTIAERGALAREAAKRGLSLNGDDVRVGINKSKNRNRTTNPLETDANKVSSIWEASGSTGLADIPDEEPKRRRRFSKKNDSQEETQDQRSHVRETVADRYQPTSWSSPPQREMIDDISQRRAPRTLNPRTSLPRDPSRTPTQIPTNPAQAPLANNPMPSARIPRSTARTSVPSPRVTTTSSVTPGRAPIPQARNTNREKPSPLRDQTIGQERPLRENTMTGSLARGNSFRERPLKENSLKDNSLRENSLRERPVRERPLRERPLRENQLQENSLRDNTRRDNTLREPLRNSPLREPPLREKARKPLSEPNNRSAKQNPRSQNPPAVTYDVELTAVGGDIFHIMQAVRDVTGLPFRESQRLVESVPKLLVSGVSQSTANSIKAKFTSLDAIVKVHARAR